MRFITLAPFLGAAAAIATSSLNLMEQLTDVPRDWHRVGRPLPSTRINLRIAMTSPNEALFEQTLYDISSPENPRYGQHLKREELKAMLRPHAEATQAVLTWLKTVGISSDVIIDDGDWINFIATVEQAEELLDTRFGVFRNKVQHVDKVRTLQYSVPEQLHKYIDMIQPTTRFDQLHAESAMPFEVQKLGAVGSLSDALDVSCNDSITPACLQDLYNIHGQAKLNNESVGFAAFNNFLDEYPRYADLAAFEAEYATFANGENFTWTSINGGKLDQNYEGDSGEANLDVQYILSTGYPVPIHAYSTAGLGPLKPDLDQPEGPGQNEPYLDFLQYILAQPDHELPHTLSTSYGEDEQSVPLRYRKKVCNLFGQLGARGVSVIFSSGDTGVGSACQTNDGKNTTRFLPIFPAACPYVTSVGATHNVEPERAIYFSSGGFSDTWKRPAYQEKAVREYLEILGDRWEGLYNPHGRGFPDVAAQGYHFHVIDQGSESLISGTSASAPTFAGVVSLLNGARVQAGKKPLGFLNPWIYSAGYKGLNDVVDGGATGCTGTDIYSGLDAPYVPYASWNATKGWDPVTGYGTPDFGKLLPLALKASSCAPDGFKKAF
ncbi:subtilisin-like protein [Polychaeton citri CBS 116435]|uniref:tripeptidyl-peptidase II n=1 Tax=Polychaeton citri CBS 116435 TaxID=1314669 RepID=A0A9P4UTK9_9PEZI|nr:subtilisin-like protein [Polychaeton citri CBS 116435]